MYRSHLAAGSIVLVLLAIGCSRNKDVETPGLPSQTLLPESSRTSEVRPAPPPRIPEETLIVIEPGAEEDLSKGLVEASKAERKRRAQAGDPEIVLTDKNLEEYQEGAQLTFVHEEEGEEGTTSDDPSADRSISDLPGDIGEQYWRDRGLQIRTAWRETIDRIDELQGDVVDYRRRFYEEDDPSVRDTMIKPAWDRALEELEEARDTARKLEDDLQSFLDLGYQSGATEEWLDEGIELEPDPEELELLRRERDTLQFDEPDMAPEDFDDGDFQ